MIRRRIVTADEQDAYEARHIYTCFQRAGKARKVKISTHRRERREAKADIAAQLRDR